MQCNTLCSKSWIYENWISRRSQCIPLGNYILFLSTFAPGIFKLLSSKKTKESFMLCINISKTHIGFDTFLRTFNIFEGCGYSKTDILMQEMALEKMKAILQSS